MCKKVSLVVLVLSVLIGAYTYYHRLPGPNGMGFHTTADQVVEHYPGITLEGKNIIVTGGYRGIGTNTVEVLAKLKPSIWLPARKESMGDCEKFIEGVKKSTGNPNLYCEVMDLASFKQVREFADNWNKKNIPLHILMLNAGLITPYNETEDGFETTWQANHLSGFLLTKLLIPKLKLGAPSRVVVVSSEAHQTMDIQWDDITGKDTWNTGTYGAFLCYCQSKTANILFSNKLNEQLKGFGVSNSLHPGTILTEISRRSRGQLFGDIFEFLVGRLGKTIPEGAATQVYVAIAPELENVGGKYFNNVNLCDTTAYASDKNAAERLWTLSEDSVSKWLY